MRQIHDLIVDPDKTKKRKPRLSPSQIKKLFMELAIEAHKLDSSNSISYYHDIFVRRLKNRYINAGREEEEKNEFFQDEVIDI